MSFIDEKDVESARTKFEILWGSRKEYGDGVRVAYVPIGKYYISVIYLYGYTEYPYEIAIKKDGSVVEFEELEYNPVDRFNTLEEVNNEITFLSTCSQLYR